MEKDIKSKVFTVIYAIVLVAVLIGAVQLLYNAIEMMEYTPFTSPDDEKFNTYGGFQKPLAIISLVAAIFAFIGVAAGVTSFCGKGKIVKAICHVFIFAVAVAMLILFIVSNNVWLNYYKNIYDVKNISYPVGLGGDWISSKFVLYSGVMSMLVPQFAYFVVLAALHIWELVKSLKKKRNVAQTEGKDGVATEEVQ